MRPFFVFFFFIGLLSKILECKKMHKYWCYGHKDGHITTLQTNSLEHAREWIKQHSSPDYTSFIIDTATGSPVAD